VAPDKSDDRYKSNYHTNTNMTDQRGTNGTNKVYKISYKSTHWFIIIRTFSDIFLILVALNTITITSGTRQIR
jgi:hypothetical protein